MDNTDSYLHKKFKKQLSIDVKPQNDKENKNFAGGLEQIQEKTTEPKHAESTIEYEDHGGRDAMEYRQLGVSNYTIEDNQRGVGRFDTVEYRQEGAGNDSIDYRLEGVCNSVTENQRIDNVPNQSTNQISHSFVLNTSNFSKSSISQTSNSCISHVVSNHLEESSSFDTTYSNQTNPNVNASSYLDTVYSKQNYVINQDDSVRINSEEQSDLKTEEIQPPPDRNASGKYVCTYCNLVCSKPSVLQKHIRAHTNERPYPCISCGFSFKTRSNLYKHCRSRTHANRVMGNKSQDTNAESDSQKPANHPRTPVDDKDVKLKPYKPRFHTAKQFYENIAKENIEEERQSNHATSELLSHHINEIINKNNSVVNSNEQNFAKKRFNDLDSVNNNEFVQKYSRTELVYSTSAVDQRTTDEPLNLSSKNRKRCMSEIAEPVVQKSLIKELLLKNLYSNDMQCPYCKMIFQTVTELDIHKYRNCKGKPSGAKYTRSSSVNVASILTQNKNAFDNIPQLQNTVFPLNSPGPFLGKTRLVDSDKSKSFSFDGGNLPLMSPSDPSPNYLLSPLHFEKEKKTSIKLFGGEVQIHSSGETKSFKIDNNDDKYEQDANYIDYGGKLSENRVIKSSLQSGGTVLTNKTNYNKQDLKTPQDVIRVYENSSVSPSIDIPNFNQPKFTFDRQPDGNLQLDVTRPTESSKSYTNSLSPLYTHTSIMDFSQKAVKMLAPNLKRPNFYTTAPNKLIFDSLTVEGKQDAVSSPQLRIDVTNDVVKKPTNSIATVAIENTLRKPQFAMARHTPDNIEVSLEPKRPANFVETPNSPRKNLFPTPRHSDSNMYNPMNLIVDGKVVRYVPGMPGPVLAENPADLAYRNSVTAVERPPARIPENAELAKISKPSNNFLQPEKVIERINRSPKPKLDNLEIKTDFSCKVSEVKSPNKTSESKSPNKLVEAKTPDSVSLSETKKFARPNSLALKPTTASLKQHHGLTPTMFNQILISPDTPRVAKKYAEHYLHGNYFSYLGLKSSTKPVYCTLNKTQPFYVPHFKKLSMYSEWRQQDTKADKLYVSNYDSRQKNQRFTVAGKTSASLIIHSSYKFMVSEMSSGKVEKGDDNQKNPVLGGYECNEDYTYIRGRGRGRYVCDQCGIRCKKPSMLKKHIRTHSNDRPYTCSHCNFSFKTKGNLTKHMKSKAHTKNYTASNGSSSSTQQSATQSSESDTDDSGMDSSDESTRQQEHEAAYGLLSLSQKPSQNSTTHAQSGLMRSSSPISGDVFMSTEEIAYVSKNNYAKNKILDEQNFNPSQNFSSTKRYNEAATTTTTTASSEETTEAINIRNYLGKSNINRPLTYPYTSDFSYEKRREVSLSPKSPDIAKEPCIEPVLNNVVSSPEPKCIKQFSVIQKYAEPISLKISVPKSPLPRKIEGNFSPPEQVLLNNSKNLSLNAIKVLPTIKVNDIAIPNDSATDIRKRKLLPVENNYKNKVQRNDEVMDLSMTTTVEKLGNQRLINGAMEDQRIVNDVVPVQVRGFSECVRQVQSPKNLTNEIYNALQKVPMVASPPRFDVNEDIYSKEQQYKNHEKSNNNGPVLLLCPLQPEERLSLNYPDHQDNHDQRNSADYDQPNDQRVEVEQHKIIDYDPHKAVDYDQHKTFEMDQTKNSDYDNSAMETLADIATKQVKLEKNTLAKSVATEFLKLATKNENLDGCRDSGGFGPVNKDVNDIIVKSEGNKSCTICAKSFNKPSQLRLHMNIHYLERPFRCESCSVSFRTKGHLQKHERSASHHNKLSTSPALSSSEPRPFKCSDCNIAFRIHGHLAKHLRSKMHIMKLECLAKIPFGLYAELERSNSLLTEINTCDGEQCLESLKTLAKKVFINDPTKLNQLELREPLNADS